MPAVCVQPCLHAAVLFNVRFSLVSFQRILYYKNSPYQKYRRYSSARRKYLRDTAAIICRRHVHHKEEYMTRDLVLSILKNSEGYVSGERISKELGLTRAAVNIAVKSLRKEGYVILSSTKKGYLLESAPDHLSSGELLTILGPERMRTVSVFDTVTSTNRVLSGLAYDDPEDGRIVIADEQTGGRGRLGRSFYSPGGCGIYLSCLFRLETPPASSIPVTAWAAVAVSKAVETVCGVQPGIKWVNDLILGGKKFGGILTEMSIEGESGHIRHIITGIGINVNNSPDDFPEELKETATSLFAETGTAFSRAELACGIIRELDLLRRAWPGGHSEYLREYRKRNITVGQKILLLNGSGRTASAESIGDDFSLSIRYPDGTADRLTSGEISIRQA